jgi:hypothetical protein
MSDAFVPEADRLDQERDVVDGRSASDERAGQAAVPIPERAAEASEADLLDQLREVVDDEGYDAY